MKSLLERLAQAAPSAPRTTLVVGAGGGAELPALRRLGSRRLILAEAYPRFAEELAQRIRPDQGEEVWPLAIVATDGPLARLRVLNNPRDSSLKPPEGLLKHYPNVRITSEIDVPVRTLADAAEQLALDAEGDHVLVIDAPGQADELLSLVPESTLQTFSTIVVRCGVEPLYTDDRSAIEVRSRLQDIGFDHAIEGTETIFPHTSILMVREPMRVRIRQLESALVEVEARRDAATRVASERAARIEELSADAETHAVRLSELEASLDVAREEISRVAGERDACSELAQRLKAKIEADASEISQLRDDLSLAVKERERLSSECDSQTRLVTERAVVLDQLVRARDAAIQQVAALKGEVDNVQAQISSLAEERDSISARLVERDHKLQELAAALEDAARIAQANEQRAQAAERSLDQLRSEHDDLAKLSAKRASEIEALTRARVASEERASALERRIVEQQKRIEQLESESAQALVRQQLMQEEFVKAEGQIELIKDLLLREPGL